MFEIVVDNTVKEKNKKEWERINNLWLEVKNSHKANNPHLYDTESDSSDDGSKPHKELKRADRSYDELLFDHDCVITEKNEIECNSPLYDGIEDSKTHFTCSSNADGENDDTNRYDDDSDNGKYKVTIDEIKSKICSFLTPQAIMIIKRAKKPMSKLMYLITKLALCSKTSLDFAKRLTILTVNALEIK